LRPDLLFFVTQIRVRFARLFVHVLFHRIADQEVAAKKADLLVFVTHHKQWVTTFHLNPLFSSKRKRVRFAKIVCGNELHCLAELA